MIRYCNQCGTPVENIIPSGDSVCRAVCPACHHIQYQNPRIIVGCIAEYQGKILLCRRAIEPRLGFWTLPAGFMENGETTQQGAAREAMEEACAKITIEAAFAMVSIAHIDQVHLFYRGYLKLPEFSSGEESLEVALFHPDEIPWEYLAFSSVQFCLEQYLADKARGTFSFHESALL